MAPVGPGGRFGKGAAEIYPQQPGGYLIIDNLRLYSAAELLVLKYSTHDVTRSNAASNPMPSAYGAGP